MKLFIMNNRFVQHGKAQNTLETAPTLVLKSEKGYFAMIVSGNRGRVNLDEISGVLGCGQLEMAAPKEVRQITGYTVGSVSLVVSLPCIVDKKLFRYPFVYGGTGEPASRQSRPTYALR
ncbi:aminoacyl-tRNA deacylase [Cohnella hongkongensis]|uniref:Aminoacyl-tRNA deacylase n=1 Tax=Cohnella hongkongensis TaxID=178337 RepID=A0ABV9FJP5_9BACL